MAAKDENVTLDDYDDDDDDGMDYDPSFFILDHLDELNQPGSRAARALNDFQNFQMEYIFKKDPNLQDHDAKSLGSSIGLTAYQVENWFQNQREKRQRRIDKRKQKKKNKRQRQNQSTDLNGKIDDLCVKTHNLFSERDKPTPELEEEHVKSSQSSEVRKLTQKEDLNEKINRELLRAADEKIKKLTQELQDERSKNSQLTEEIRKLTQIHVFEQEIKRQSSRISNEKEEELTQRLEEERLKNSKLTEEVKKITRKLMKMEDLKKRIFQELEKVTLED